MTSPDRSSLDLDSRTPTVNDLEAGHIMKNTTDTENNVEKSAPGNVSTPSPGTKDPNMVDWDGENDPANPRNWKNSYKMMHVIFVSAFTLCSNLAAVMFAPGADDLAREFHITNSTIGTLTVSLYVLGFAIGPLVLAPGSELYGRLVLYHACNVVYIAFILGCALSTNTGMFLAFRFISGCAASAPMAIGGGSIADLYPPEERGKAMALFGLGPLLGPVIGPVIGGFVTENIGWRWTFWLMMILSSVISLTALVLMRETMESRLLERKAARLRKETGNDKLWARTRKQDIKPGQLFVRAITRPTKMLIFSPIILLMSLYSAFVFGLIYLLFTTFTSVFEDNYGFGPGISGLSYLGLGIGMIVGVALFGVLSDKLLKNARGGTAGRPELRLVLMMWFSPVIPIGFFWYGWSAQAHTHWIVPIMGTLVIGLGIFMIMMPAQIYLVDAFGAGAAASALAANTVLRNTSGAFLPLAGTPLYNSLGLGWGNSLLAFIGIVFAPVPIFFYRYGESLRARFPVDY